MQGQIADFARKYVNTQFSNDFRNIYDMEGIVFSLGTTTIGGIYSGTCHRKDGGLKIEGTITFYLKDKFKDAADIFNRYEDDIEFEDGTPYDIYDNWAGTFEGFIYEDRTKSDFLWEGEK